MTEAHRALGLPQPWPAPGKLNLCLQIVGRRADGYHLLQSAIQFIDLQDEIKLWWQPAGVIERIGEHAHIPEQTDLTLKAARLLAASHAAPAGVAIELTKHLPVQAGLGGGSSDAATVLVALNEVWGLGLSTAQLMALGLTLGADVPVFVSGQAAWVEGIGERLTVVDLPVRHYVVVWPDAAVSTAEIFQAPELTRDSPVITIRGFLESGGRNDCTSVVRSRYPAVAEALDWLARFTAARLTGTGSCVYGAVPDESTGRAVLAQLPAGWQGYLVRGLNSSPLADRIALERAARADAD